LTELIPKKEYAFLEIFSKRGKLSRILLLMKPTIFLRNSLKTSLIKKQYFFKQVLPIFEVTTNILR